MNETCYRKTKFAVIYRYMKRKKKKGIDNLPKKGNLTQKMIFKIVYRYKKVKKIRKVIITYQKEQN